MMKKLWMPVLALLGAAMPAGHAFTLDAAGYGGGTLEVMPYSVLVPGYGEVVFEDGIGVALVVDSAYGNGAGCDGSGVSFSANDSVGFDFSDPGESGGARRSHGWNAIPEPATAGLGLVGIAALLLGRRR